MDPSSHKKNSKKIIKYFDVGDPPSSVVEIILFLFLRNILALPAEYETTMELF